MKSAAYASYVAAGAVPCEPDDDPACKCLDRDAATCMALAKDEYDAENPNYPERCPCPCHANALDRPDQSTHPLGCRCPDCREIETKGDHA